MDKLVVEEKDVISIFDRGYIYYKKFDDYCEKGIRFVTRLKANAVATVQKELPVAPGSVVMAGEADFLDDLTYDPVIL